MARNDRSAAREGGRFSILKIPFPYPRSGARRYIRQGAKRITKKV